MKLIISPTKATQPAGFDHEIGAGHRSRCVAGLDGVVRELAVRRERGGLSSLQLTLLLSLDGRVAATLGEVPDITATLSAKTVDLDELLATGRVTRDQIPSLGCNIKWK